MLMSHFIVPEENWQSKKQVLTLRRSRHRMNQFMKRIQEERADHACLVLQGRG